MLYYKKGVTKDDQSSINEKWTIWHVGTPEPIERSQVMTFQADGDELQIILEAIHKYSKKF